MYTKTTNNGIIFREEQFSTALSEMQPLFSKHWDEFGEGNIPLDLDIERYSELAEQGILRCLIARKGEKLIGYAWVMVCKHLHHKTVLTGMVDVYYLLPEHRSGIVGVKFFRAIENMLKDAGAQKVFMGARPYRDAAPIFKRLHWQEVERGYSKAIGGYHA